ncbi:hypothetical protein PMAYCL1PPCAC_33024, partial [Pristionchus mayeri]
ISMALFLLLVLLPFTQSQNPAFDEDLARNVMMPLCSAAYTKNPQPCLDYKMSGAKVSMRVEVPCDDIDTDTCSGFTMVDETRKRIGLVFRGTSTGDQLKDEIMTTLFENKTDFRDGGMTSPYFADAFDDLWFNSGLGADFLYLANKYPGYTLLITGHSLGGTFASLATVHILVNKLFPADQTIYYSLGEPRTGNKEFADLLDSLTVAYRIVHNKDVIPHVPFVHVMEYQHHKYEIYYANDMSEGQPNKLCKQQEDPTCSKKNVGDLVFNPDHLMYFNENLLNFGANACMSSTPPPPPSPRPTRQA